MNYIQEIIGQLLLKMRHQGLSRHDYSSAAYEVVDFLRKKVHNLDMEKDVELEMELNRLYEAEMAAELVQIPLYPRPQNMTIEKARAMTREYWAEVRLLLY